MTKQLLDRNIQTRLEKALLESPVVLVCGPRQTGKTTLVRYQLQSNREYFTFDDPVLREAAKADPVGFVKRLPDKCTLDEIQFAPEILGSLKQEVDRDRVPGRFILTGSAQVLMLPTVSESLAGRLSIVPLLPFGQTEIEQRKSKFLQLAFSGDILDATPKWKLEHIAERVLRGGFPDAALKGNLAAAKRWQSNYVSAILQKDIRELARIDHAEVLPRLMRVLASRTAQLLSLNAMAGEFQLSRTTLDRYSGLLKQLFLIDTLPPWFTNATKQLTKTPKLHLVDSGLAAMLSKVELPILAKGLKYYGQLVESFVYGELKKMMTWEGIDDSLFHYRSSRKHEVDVVLEGPGRTFVGIEVKASMTISRDDFKGLMALREDMGGGRFKAGIVLYEGEHALSFGHGLVALPIPALWKL